MKKPKAGRKYIYIRDDPPKPAFNMDSLNGWLSPDGKYYACEFNGHVALAGQMGQLEKTLESLGWIKISDAKQSGQGAPRNLSSVTCIKTPTQKQRDKVWDWCQRHGRDYEREMPKE